VQLDYAYGTFLDNTILVHLPDGIYTTYPSPSFERHTVTAKTNAPSATTSSFDALMKLKTLVECIDDAVDTQRRIAHQIETMLAAPPLETINRARAQAQTLHRISDEKARLAREIARLQHDREATIGRQQARQHAFAQARLEQRDRSAEPASLRHAITASAARRAPLQAGLRAQAARVAEALLAIFPIAAAGPRRRGAPELAIRGLALPHARAFEALTAPPADEPQIAAALGFVATVLQCLGRTLLLHAPYPVRVFGSASAVADEITSARELEASRLGAAVASARAGGYAEGGAGGSRTFPLYARGADLARFRYAVYLLNRDLEELAAKCGLRVVDVRDTLANARFLLDAIAGGAGDLPARTAGSVLALGEEGGREG